MRTDAPSLLPVLRSQVQGLILAEVLLRPDAEVSVRELARRTGAAVSTVHAEVERLVGAGILTGRTEGRSRLLRAGSGRLVRPLTELIAMTYGPRRVIAEEFGSLPGARRVLVYGSWAARYRGEPGPPPNDVDVLVVGDVRRVAAHAAAERAERRLRIDVNVVVVTPERFAAADSPLLREIAVSPTVDVLGGEEQ